GGGSDHVPRRREAYKPAWCRSRRISGTRVGSENRRAKSHPLWRGRRKIPISRPLEGGVPGSRCREKNRLAVKRTTPASYPRVSRSRWSRRADRKSMASGCRSTRTPFHVGTPASVVSAEASWPAACSARASSPRYLHGCSFRDSGGRVSVRIAIRRVSMAQPAPRSLEGTAQAGQEIGTRAKGYRLFLRPRFARLPSEVVRGLKRISNKASGYLSLGGGSTCGS